LLNATVGVRRVLSRLSPTQARRQAAAHSPGRALRIPGVVVRTRSIGRPTPGRPRLSGERLVSLTAVGLVAAAVALSNLGAVTATGPTGNTDGPGTDPRIAVGGALSGLDAVPGGDTNDQIDGNVGTTDGADNTLTAAGSLLSTGDVAQIDGPFNADGMLVKPSAVDTSFADGKDLLRIYRVRSGDTLVGIASRFKVSMMTLWWANHLSSKDHLRIGQTIKIPPTDGLVVTVSTTDTLDILSARYDVSADDILSANGLVDPNLIVGQTLTIPGARGAQIPVPVSKPTPPPTTHPTQPSSNGGGGTSRPPARYTGGKFLWPVPGGYISQYFHYGHYAIDIAAPYGSRVLAAASGTVIFAGWKDNGGGYQVWISHGSNLYTTYNHMSSITVGQGQFVGRGQQVGRIGMTGDATGPHCHFEVWRGPIWNGGTRVNPLLYL
jgi:murein DD-endopeptidase MepM/ murein hydrolase activator NlpD